LVIQRASRASHIPADARLRSWARAALRRPAAVTLRFVAGRPVAEGVGHSKKEAQQAAAQAALVSAAERDK